MKPKLKLKPGMILCARRNTIVPHGEDIVFVVGKSRIEQSNGPSWTLMFKEGQLVKLSAPIIQRYYKPL